MTVRWPWWESATERMGWKGRAHRGGENRASISGRGVSFLGERLGLSQLLAWEEEKKMHMCLGIGSED